MRIFLSVAGVVVGTIAWIVWRATRCSRHGCGVQELTKDREA